MRHFQTIALLGSVIFSIGLANCTSTETIPAERAKAAAVVMEVPVIPDDPPASHEPSALSGRSGEIQEREVNQLVPGTFTPGGAVLGGLSLPLTSAYPGEFAFRTQKGFYLTAINGGGRIADPIVVTAATAAGAWEKFKLAIATPPSAYDKTIQTATGNYADRSQRGWDDCECPSHRCDTTQRLGTVQVDLHGRVPSPVLRHWHRQRELSHGRRFRRKISGCSAQRRQADPGLGAV